MSLAVRSSLLRSLLIGASLVILVAGLKAAAVSTHAGVIEREIRLGEVSSQVLAAAAEWRADVVVLGSDARPALLRLLLGSSAVRVLDDVPSSVLIARGAGHH